MNDVNPYTAPDAPINVQQEEYYQPKVLSFKGRIGRLRYLAYGVGTNILLMFAMSILVGGLASIDAVSDTNVVASVLLVLVYAAMVVFTIMFGKRRLNDLNKSGWWLFVLLVPLANMALTIYLIFFAGTAGVNDYGPVPVENTLGVKILGLLLPVIFVLGVLSAIAIPAFNGYVQQAQQMQQP